MRTKSRSAPTRPKRPGVDRVTRRWIRDKSDERAAARGCRVDEARGEHVIEFFRKYLHFYEGDGFAGEPFEVQPWQRDFLMRLFGWVRWSDHYGRWIRRFKRAGLWVPKKNGKSPMLAALGLYLLCADGEPGQKVFFAAKDGQQAREIAGKHALEMVLASPLLLTECTINRNLMQVTHEPSRSILKPLSSANKRTQDSKHGLNGSVLKDECHVIDRPFAAILEGAGISRSEALDIEVSTAGNNPEGYGREQWEYGQAVADGRIEDDQFLFVAYSAPQNLSDAELLANPMKWGRMANPSWGVTFAPDEFLGALARAQRSPAALAEFKMLRLNIWQRSSNPWLRSADWDLCRSPLSDDELRGRPCWAGLDGGGAQDTTALVLVFALDDGRVYLRPSYWLARERAEELAGEVRLLEWGAAGHLTLTEGHLANHEAVEDEFVRLYGLFRPRKLLFDPGGVSTLVARICNRIGVRDRDYCLSFAQSPANYSEACNRFEELVLSRKLAHPGNPLLNWQAGNVKIKVTADGYKKPIKPDHGSYQTVDGIQAAVMALAGQMTAPPESVYNRRGFLVL